MGKVKYRVLAILILFTVLGGTLLALPGYAAGAEGEGPTFTQQFNPDETKEGERTAKAVAAACGTTIETIIDAAMIEKTTSLSLSSQGLTQIDGIEIFSKLDYLDLKNNLLTSVPDSIGNLVNLQALYLSDNQLESLPDSIGELKKLKQIYLEYNHLRNLPESIGELSTLEDLILGSFEDHRGGMRSNQLTSLPESIGKLTSLKALILGNNQLTSLPDSIGNLEQLEMLDLSTNQLTNLPDSIGTLGSLKALGLAGNQLTNLPSSIRDLNLNRGLTLGHNLLPSDCVAKLKALNPEWTIPEVPQDQLILKTEGLPTESIRTQPDLAAYVQIKRVNEDGSEAYIAPSPTHQFNLENIEEGYFDAEGNAMKDGTITANIRAMGSGLFENNSDRAVTTEPITLTIQSLYHPVKFDPNGTGVNQMPESQEILRGRLLTKPEAEPQRAGYTFLKWSTDPEGQVAWDFDSDTMPDEAITLYATWEAIPESSDPRVNDNVNTGIQGRNEQMMLALGIMLMSLLGGLGIWIFVKQSQK